jgi:D-alanine-D-alanine ligase
MVQEIGNKVFQLLDCRDYARVDFRLKDRALYILEVNPNPCINPDDSGLIRASEAIGLKYDDVIHTILEQSIKAWKLAYQPANQEVFR